MNLDSFFFPKSIAIVGASPKKGKLGNILAENIRRGGWNGKMYFVNPKYSKNKKGYFASLRDIKKPVDLALIAIPAPLVNEVLKQSTKSKPAIKNFAVISSGFKETGKEGKILEGELENIAEKYDLNILGPNCLGFVNPYANLNATFTDNKLQKGKIAIVSQSGALAVALLDWAAGIGIGFSKIISIGNKTDIGESEILEFLARDKSTEAVLLYLEGIKKGSQFMNALSKISAKKPVVVLKAGKTNVGQKAVSSHTGSLAQNEEIVEAVLEKCNAIFAKDIGEFQDIAYFLSCNPIPLRNEVIILTNAGGPGVMASDFVGSTEVLKLVRFSDEFRKELKKSLPGSASSENPIDVIGDAPPKRYQKTLEILSKKYSRNPIVLILTPQNQTDPKKVASILVKIKKKLPEISACFMGGEKIGRAKSILQKNKIANFESPERALDVIEKLAKYSKNRNNNYIIANKKINRSRQVKNIFEKTRAQKRGILFWREAESLFGKYGIKFSPTLTFADINEIKKSKLRFPCVLKTDDPKIAHRLGNNGLVLNVKNIEELERSYLKMKRITGAKNFIIQPMIPIDLELIIGMKRDPVFGPTILVGWGGSFTEIFKDKVILIPPLDSSYIREKLAQLEIFPILKGFRGEKAYNIEEISRIVSAVGSAATENPEIEEIDINPLVVYNNGTKGKILDAKVFL